MSFDVPITDDTVLEGDEKFSFAIRKHSLPSGIVRGRISRCTILIVEKNCKQLCYPCSV